MSQDDWHPSFSPSGRYLARGSKDITVTDLRHWVVVARIPGAAGPQWLDEDTILYATNQEGVPPEIRAYGRLTLTHRHFAGAMEGWTCHNGRPAFWQRDDAVKSVTISRSGVWAGCRAVGSLQELYIAGEAIDAGDIVCPRYTGEALVWMKRAANGQYQTWGRQTRTSPNEPLWVRGDGEFWPIAIETPHGLYVATHGHADLYCRKWGERERGWIVKRGVADFPAACWDGQQFVFATSDRGVGFVRHLQFSEPMEVIGPNPPIVVTPPPAPEPPTLTWPDPTFVVDPRGRVEDTWSALIDSASAFTTVNRDTTDLYFPKEDGQAGEHWRLAGERAWHQFDRRFAGDPGWWLERGAWFRRTIWTGLTERFEDVLHEASDGFTRPFIYTLTYYVAVDGRFMIKFDNRDEKPPTQRRPGRCEFYTFGEAA